MGKIIAVVSGKGGTGKTSFTACVSLALAAMGHTTLALDCDITLRNLDLALGLSDSAAMDFSDVLEGRCTLTEAAVPHRKYPKLSLLAAPLAPVGARFSLSAMQTLAQEIRQRYDYCLMDCPPDLDMGSINALTAADWVIIPVDCDEWACDGMREIMDQIEQVQMYYNPHLKVMGALMTKYRRTRYAGEVVHQLNEAGIEMLHTVIRYTVKVSEAKSAHEPLRVYKPDCSAALDYGCLADEVDEAVSKMDTHKEG